MQIEALELMEKLSGEFNRRIPPCCPNNVNTNSEYWEETSEFWGKRWDEIDFQLFDKHHHVFSFINREYFPYYFGAMMYKMLEARVYDCGALDSFLSFWYDGEFLVGVKSVVEGVKFRYAAELSASLDGVKVNLMKEFFKFRSEELEREIEEEVPNFFNAIAKTGS